MGQVPSSEPRILPVSQQEVMKVMQGVSASPRGGEEKEELEDKQIEETTQDRRINSEPNGNLQRLPIKGDDAMPLDAQHHAAVFLSCISSPFIPTDEIATILKNSTYINQKRKILGRTHISPITPNNAPTPSTTSPTLAERLLDLPAELFSIIKELLPPADVIALSFTSKTFYTTLDFQLIDLRNLVLASDLYDHYMDQKFAYPINRERYDVCRRLRRDKMAKLITLEDPSTDQILCSACTRLHPKRYFSPSQLSTPPLTRNCLATTAPLNFCAHWSENLQSLRARNESARCYPRAIRLNELEICQHQDHYTSHGAIYNPPPELRELQGIQTVTRTLRLGHTDDYDLITPAIVRETLEKDPIAAYSICPHVQVSSPSVSGSFQRKKEKRDFSHLGEYAHLWCSERPEFERGKCGECGMGWQFEIQDTRSLRGGQVVLAARWELRLRVEWEVKAAREAWSRGWLRFVEGGEGLMELL